MRILFQTYSLAFQAPGGGERVILELRAALQSLGHEVDLFSPWKQDPEDYQLVHYFSVLESDAWCHHKKAFRTLPLFVTPTLYLDLTLRNRIHFAREKLTATLGLAGPRNLYRNMAFADHYFPTTEYEETCLKKYFGIPSSRLSVMPNGVGEHFYSGDAALFRDFSGVKGPFVLHVGRFHPVKEQETLIRALKGTGIQCVFIGDRDKSHPEYLDFCLSQAKESSTNNFHFFPAFAHEDPRFSSALSAAALFAFPSRFETFGLAPLEAALAGCPLLLSDRMADKAVFGKAATFLPPGDHALWKEEILKQMTSPARLTESLRAALRDRYSWKKIASEVLSVYSRYTGV
ncbi:MAG: glycosyltransferase family 4 protein [Bdellovibrionota bacterium]